MAHFTSSRVGDESIENPVILMMQERISGIKELEINRFPKIDFGVGKKRIESHGFN